jgi:hypothetical protein
MTPARRFSVEEYHRMIGAGILTKDDKVELLEGWIIPKLYPRTPAHDGTIECVYSSTRDHLPEGWDVRINPA